MELQKEWFSKINTDWLLSMRYQDYCGRKRYDNDMPIYFGSDFAGYPINKKLLYAELKTRPHRVRARHRRLKKNGGLK